MTLEEMLVRIKSHPRISEAGMILCHNGKPVSAINVKAHHEAVSSIISEIKARPGIIEVLVELNQGTLSVGDDIMLVAIAGDIREHVFPALQDLVQRIKQQITEKEEILSS